MQSCEEVVGASVVIVLNVVVADVVVIVVVVNITEVDKVVNKAPAVVALVTVVVGPDVV